MLPFLNAYNVYNVTILSHNPIVSFQALAVQYIFTPLSTLMAILDYFIKHDSDYGDILGSIGYVE